MRVLLISTYDMGRQPFGLASPAAWLKAAGLEAACADLSRERLSEAAVRAADFVAFFLPMHTATRLAIPVIDRVRALNRDARLCAYGLYAPLNDRLLREHGIEDVLGGEFEEDLRDLALGRSAIRSEGLHLRDPGSTQAAGAIGSDAELKLRATGEAARRNGAIPRLRFIAPDRSSLPALSKYATLQIGSERRVVGYTEASRGCKHRCRHCPIVPVYDGRFRIVPVEVVMADVRAQVEAGARHITFGDPDFFNGIGHAAAVLEAFGREFHEDPVEAGHHRPGSKISYDVTIKIEHLLQHADRLPLLRETGCAFVTSAVESVDDEVLAKLEKGHTRADFERVVRLCDAAGIVLSPTFVAFTPWTTLGKYCELLAAIDDLGLVDHVAPNPYSIRLLITEGSRLLELPDIAAAAPRFDPRSLTYPWRHADPRVDALQAAVADLAGVRLTSGRREVFARLWDMAHEAAGTPPPPRREPALPRAAVPYLNEPWYCLEPSPRRSSWL